MKPAPDDDYDAAADMTASIAECYRAIRERIANGGPPWVPPVVEPPQKPAQAKVKPSAQ